MSGQDYVYIVLHQYFRIIVGTAPTKYQARALLDKQPKPDVLVIQRWRHGDTKGVNVS